MWEKIEVYPYQRKGEEIKKNPVPVAESVKKPGFKAHSILKFFSLANIMLCLAGFFIGRAILLGELVPFGAAFVGASSRLFAGSGLAALAAVMAGLITVREAIPLPASVATVILVWLATRTLLRGFKKEWLVVPGIVFTATVVVKTTFVAFANPSLYGYITVIFEAVFAGVLSFIFLNALSPFVDSQKIRPLDGEEVFCLLVLFAGIIAGCNSFSYNVVTLDGVIIKTFILLAALVGGGGLGAATGAVAGIVPALGNAANPTLLGAYSFAGLLAGVFRSFGKAGVVAGFVLGNIILSLYLSNFGQLTHTLAETGIAVLFILLIPGRVIDKIKIFLKTQIPSGEKTLVRDMRLKEVIQARFREWSRMFGELSRAFEQVSPTAQPSREEKGLQDLFNEVAHRVCEGCALYKTCWEREFYRTYQDVLDIFSMVEAYGKANVDDVPEKLRRRCGRIKEMCVTVECLYDTYKIDQYWSQRFLESRDLVSAQLRGVAKIMESLSEEIELDSGKDKEVDRKLKEELRKQGISIVDLYTVSRENGKFEINVSMPSCEGKMDCEHKIAPFISDVMKQDFAVAGHCNLRDGEEICSFRLYPSLKYRVATGVAKIGKHGSNISGDNHSFQQLGNGDFAILLSDGMGSGSRAALESNTAISLLEHLLESGFGHRLAIKTVNATLALRGLDESFCTIDLAIINLYNAEAKISKIGAPPSYLVRGGKVRTIMAESLPAGVLKDIDVSTVNYMLKEGDLLIMITDGALDNNGLEDGEEHFLQILKDTIDLDKSLAANPQDFAGVLLKEAYREGGRSRIKDDITIIAAALQESHPKEC